MSGALRASTFQSSPDRVRPAESGQNLADAAVTLLLTRSASVMLAWVLEIALVRALEPDSWASMSRFLTLTTLFSVAQLGLPESVLYFASRARSNGSALALTARTSALLAAVGALLALPFYVSPELAVRLLGEQGPSAVVPLSLFVMSDLAFAPLPSLLLARHRAKLASALSFGTRLLIALLVGAALAGGFGLEGALYAMALGASASAVLGWAVVVSVTRGDKPARPVSVREQLGFSMPVGLTRFVQIGNAKLDKYIVMTVFAESVYGTYYLGAAELPIPSMICTAVMSVMMADMVTLAEAGDRTAFVDLWHKSIQKIALVTMPFFCFGLIFAQPIFVALYGAAHEGAAAQFRIFQILLLARVTNYSSVSLALGQPRVPFVAAIIALSLNGALGFVGVRTLGLSGPAFANVASISISTVYTLWAIRRSLRVPWSKLFPLRSYLHTLGVAIIALLPAAAVLMLELPAWLTVAAGATVYLPVYLYLCQASALLGAEDRAFLRGVVKLHFLHPAARRQLTG